MPFDRSRRQRKTKDPCLVCWMHKAYCICSQIPRLDLKTRVSLIVHAKELKRTTNTGRLAIHALSNSSMHVRGEGRTALDLQNLLLPDYQTVMLFPSNEAIELSEDWVQKNSKPIHLIVPDGNWRQASKVQTRHSELSGIPRVKLCVKNVSPWKLRKETTENGMATLEAIAYALSILEGHERVAPLFSVYQAKVQNTMRARGLSPYLNLT